jgi:hypothetical protein
MVKRGAICQPFLKHVVLGGLFGNCVPGEARIKYMNCRAIPNFIRVFCPLI